MWRWMNSLFLLCVVSGAASGLTVNEPGYLVETYAQYSPVTTHTLSMTFDNMGTLYTIQPYDDKAYQISTDGTVRQFTGIGTDMSGSEWAGGTAYGDYVYIAAYSELVRLASDGTSSTFAAGFPAASEVVVDRTGNYGGALYVSTGGQDRIYRVDTAGDVSVFSNWPGLTNGGGPVGLEIDDTGDYGGLMYVATSFGANSPSKSGLFTIDTGGTASRFADDIVVGWELDFDTSGLFDGDMFVLGASDFAEAMGIWRVAPDGTASLFATTTESRIGSIVFGPDAALYVSEYSADTGEITITRVIPEPTTVLLVALGGLTAMRPRQSH